MNAVEKKVAAARERAASSAKRTTSTDTLIAGPADIAETGGTVSLVERSRKRGEPSITLSQRDAHGSPVPTDLVGVVAAVRGGLVAVRGGLVAGAKLAD